ncbi:glycoside hydrolase family 19 protein [Allorhizobium undicola]|uniref:glycoside hydrolase family 19 protein n=1 Tax=Allorhizobium undicola TaxID=78527 RepID=UPI003D328DF8
MNDMVSRRLFNHLRAALFGGRLTQGQVDGVNAILRGWRQHGQGGNPDQLAYVLATAVHETAGRLAPVRETLAESDAEAVARLEAAYGAGRLPQVSQPYWRPDEEGKSWFGRGFVQLTFRRNYERMGEALGLDLVADPDLALKSEVAADALVAGMRQGLFTGRRLDEFLQGERQDWVGARRIVNGLDRAEKLGLLAQTIREGLS